MVKFSRGMWWVAPDITINWAVEIVKSEAFKDNIRALAVRSLLIRAIIPMINSLLRPVNILPIEATP